jgi:hypothetical protein
MPPDAVTVTLAEKDVTVLPFASATRMTGCVGSTDPDAPAVGWVAMTSMAAAPGLTDTDAEVPGASGPEPAWSVAVTVAVPAVFAVTANALVPDTSAALVGRVAFASVLEIATVGVANATTFQFASTALTVTVNDEPDVCAVGDPALPDPVPGAAVSPGSSTCSLDAVPALTVTDALVLAVSGLPA